MCLMLLLDKIFSSWEKVSGFPLDTHVTLTCILYFNWVSVLATTCLAYEKIYWWLFTKLIYSLHYLYHASGISEILQGSNDRLKKKGFHHIHACRTSGSACSPYWCLLFGYGCFLLLLWKASFFEMALLLLKQGCNVVSAWSTICKTLLFV